VLFVFLPIVKSDFWIFRSLEYSRFQNFIISLVLEFIWLVYFSFYHQIDKITLALNIICLIYLSIKIFPYTILNKKEIKQVKTTNPDREIKILNANVLQTNRQYSALLAQIKSYQPDLIFLLETDHKWMNAVQDLKKDYSFFIEVPQENTYGMLFYSKFQINNQKINFLVKDDIPSISCQVVLPDKTQVQVWGLHPESPVPGESLTSTAKDKELSIIALKAKECDDPVIVMGDLNDVAWSSTTSLFTKTSRLLDVRKGRGFYSTFSAHHWFIRFPLDYIFCSADFGFIGMKRLHYNGSDHFPIFTHLIYHPNLENQQKKNIEPEREKEAKEKATQSIQND